MTISGNAATSAQSVQMMNNTLKQIATQQVDETKKIVDTTNTLKAEGLGPKQDGLGERLDITA
ncbi:MAG TPA: hypothetical protein ENJ29_04190 [Bacteroidetes bacterium]|nr:hypothetical protein [Bacteroidota bacterium]